MRQPNGLFIALSNRFGSEGLLHFYSTSCIIDAFSRVLVEAPRDEATALGTNRAIWLCKGLWRDNFLNGTKGHVDIVACFAPDGCLLVHQQTSQDHPDFALWDTLAEQFREKGLEVVPVEATLTLKDNRDCVDYSYINHSSVMVPSSAITSSVMAPSSARASMIPRTTRHVNGWRMPTPAGISGC